MSRFGSVHLSWEPAPHLGSGGRILRLGSTEVASVFYTREMGWMWRRPPWNGALQVEPYGAAGWPEERVEAVLRWVEHRVRVAMSEVAAAILREE